MFRYLIKFEKLGNIRYISHLDLMRLFQRAFKRAGIILAYSQGFNPHPKMSFAQPLSLGFSSIGEYLEFETVSQYNDADIITGLNKVMPEGIKIIGCISLEADRKTAASVVAWARYEITLNIEAVIEDRFTDMFLMQENISVLKRRKKNGMMKETDIKPFIKEFKILEQENDRTIFMAVLRAGSDANLNPELLIRAFCQYIDIPFEIESIRIKRLDLYDKEMRSLI